MALRALAGKLRTTFTLRATGPKPLPPKLSQRSKETLDPANFASVKEYTEAVLDNLDREFRQTLEELRRRQKVYDRAVMVARLIGGAAAVSFVWSIGEAIIEDDEY